MATPAGALSRTDLGTGNTDNVREDLTDIIYNIDPTETRFMRMRDALMRCPIATNG